MAHIILRPAHDNPGAMELIINGIDYSMETYGDARIVSVGEDPRFAEVGFQVTFAISRLDLGGSEDVQITDRLPAVAHRVQSMIAEGAS